MRTPSDSSLFPTHPADARGGTLVHALALLGVIGLSTLAVSLYVSHRQTQLGREILGIHQTWSDRLARYGRIGQLALAITAPCNEVFDSGDLPGETARSHRARLAFDAEMDSARLELSHLKPSVGGSLLADLEVIRNATDNMTVDVDRTFASFSVGALPPDAAVINQHVAHIDAAIDRLAGHARDAEGLESKQLLGTSAFLERMAFAIPLMIAVGMIIVIARRRSSAGVSAPAEGEESVVDEDAARVDDDSIGADASVAVETDAAIGADASVAVETDAAIEAGASVAVETDAAIGAGTAVAVETDVTIGAGTAVAVEPDASIGASPGPAAVEESKSAVLAEPPIAALMADLFEPEVLPASVSAAVAPALAEISPPPDLTVNDPAAEQLRRLTLVASKTASGVLITDARGHADWINDSFTRITGYRLEDLDQQTPDSFLRGPNTDPDALDRMVQGLRSGTEFQLELANQTTQGRPYWIELDATPIFDDGGQLCQFVLVLTDVSERKGVEAALRESEARTLAIVESGTDGVAVLDELGAITTINPAFERIFAYRPGELIGMNVRTLIAGLDGHTNGHNGNGVSTGHAPTGARRELAGRRRNGSVFPIELAVGERGAEGRQQRVIVVRDITQRKQVEALQAGQNRVIELLASEAPLVGPLTELIHLVERQQPGSVCAILILDPSRAHLRIGASPSLSSEISRAIESVEVGPSGCTWGAAAYSRKRVIVEDTSIHPSWSGFRRLALDHGLRASLAEPILSASGEVLGVFLAFHRRVHTPDSRELEIFSSAAQMAGIAIERDRSIGALAESRQAASPSSVLDAG